MSTNIPQHTHDQTDESRPSRPYWKRAHYDWKFWIAVLLMLAAMAIYMNSNNLSERPHSQMQHRVP